MDPRTQAPEEARAGDHAALCRPGRRTRKPLQEAPRPAVAAGEAFVRTIRHFWPDLPDLLGRIPDTRDQRLVIYDRRFLQWWGILLYACKLGSLRQMDFELRDLGGSVLTNVNRLAGTTQDSLPVDGTLDHFVGHVGPDPQADLRLDLVRSLIRSKALDDARLQGAFVVVVDGTGWLTFSNRHCECCLEHRQGDGLIYLHLAQEAKLIGPAGMTLSIGTQFIEDAPKDAGSHTGTEDPPKDAKRYTEAVKEDCELTALKRLASDLKENFPQLPICLSGDALYACGAGIDAARTRGWSFVYTFKEGRMPAVWAEFQTLLTLSPENRRQISPRPGVTQEYSWVNDLSYTDDQKCTRMFNALQCLETDNGVTTRFAWMTGIPLSPTNVVAVATKGGRARSQVENEGFNIQKNHGFNLEHAYSHDPQRAKAYYYLLQIAHIFLQVLEKGSLLRKLVAGTKRTVTQIFGSLKNIARRLLEAFRCFVLPDEAFALDGKPIQIRFESS